MIETALEVGGGRGFRGDQRSGWGGRDFDGGQLRLPDSALGWERVGEQSGSQYESHVS